MTINESDGEVRHHALSREIGISRDKWHKRRWAGGQTKPVKLLRSYEEVMHENQTYILVFQYIATYCN